MKSINAILKAMQLSDKPDELHVSILKKWITSEPTIEEFRNSGRIYPVSFVETINPAIRVHHATREVVYYLFGFFVQSLATGGYLYDHADKKHYTLSHSLEEVEKIMWEKDILPKLRKKQ
ncbi:MAG: hypothetical protein [Podoviridae sp. ctrTa16]|nr:MAG: hypothetical protein [Podoviridae sp. ctrTa16]